MERYKKITVLQDELEAKRMEFVLKEHGIPHRIRSYHDSAYDGLFQVAKGWGHVEAPEEFKDEIKALQKDLPGEPAPGETDHETGVDDGGSEPDTPTTEG